MVFATTMSELHLETVGFYITVAVFTLAEMQQQPHKKANLLAPIRTGRNNLEQKLNIHTEKTEMKTPIN